MKQGTIKEIREELIDYIQCDDNVITCYELTFDEEVKIEADEILKGLEQVYRVARGVKSQIPSLRPTTKNSHSLLDRMFDPLFNAIEEVKKNRKD